MFRKLARAPFTITREQQAIIVVVVVFLVVFGIVLGALLPRDGLSAQCRWVKRNLVGAQDAVPQMPADLQPYAREQLPSALEWADKGCPADEANLMEDRLLATYQSVMSSAGAPPAATLKPEQVIVTPTPGP
jgi:hypothetical protein